MKNREPDDIVEGLEHLDFIRYANRHANVSYTYDPETMIGLIYLPLNDQE